MLECARRLPRSFFVTQFLILVRSVSMTLADALIQAAAKLKNKASPARFNWHASNEDAAIVARSFAELHGLEPPDCLEGGRRRRALEAVYEHIPCTISKVKNT